MITEFISVSSYCSFGTNNNSMIFKIASTIPYLSYSMILQINNSNCEGVISLKTGLFIPCVNHTLKN